MKLLPSFLIALLGTSLLWACTPAGDRPQTPSPPTPSTIPTPQPSRLTPELFSLDDLFAQAEGGCGMTLWHQDDDPRPPGYLFFNGLASPADDALALMKIEGEFVRFRRINESGAAFYGQQTSQTFTSLDNAIQLQVNTTLGEPGEIESFAVEGTLQLQHDGATLEIPVRGSAGC